MFTLRNMCAAPRLISLKVFSAGSFGWLSMGVSLFSHHSALHHSLASWEAAGGGKTLVIVESPAKALTIQKLMDSDAYVVDCSVGHIFELSSSAKKQGGNGSVSILNAISLTTGSLGVDVFNNFAPRYVPLPNKREVISRLKAKAQECSRILLATDDDREGEAIAWHLVELLKPTVPYKRAVFHEITKEALVDSFRLPRDIDMDLVNSQEARRVLDRLVGFTVSPILWRFVGRDLSVGRVQSCGLNLIAEVRMRTSLC